MCGLYLEDEVVQRLADLSVLTVERVREVVGHRVVLRVVLWNQCDDGFVSCCVAVVGASVCGFCTA